MNLPHSHAAELVPVDELPKLDQFPAKISEDTSQAPEPLDNHVPSPMPQVLGDAEVKALLERLPALPAPTEQPFTLRPSSEPPPQTSQTVQQPFPPPVTTEVASAVKQVDVLSVTRFAPQGQVELANQISVSFSQPMVAVSTQHQTLAESVPVEIKPALEGHWRWMGTQTLVFEPKDGARLPMSTDVRVLIPADTKAADGSRLAKSVQWAFSTPTIKLQNSYPSGDSVDLNPLLFLQFNQRIDPKALLPFIQVEANGQRLTAHLATEDEIKADQMIADLIKQAAKNQSVVLKLDQPLNPKTKLNIKLAAKAPSAEGPRETPAQPLYTFSTYAPLAMTASRCGWSDHCTALDALELTFNNALASDQELKKLITITPAVDSIESASYSNNIRLNGPWQANTTYTVTLSPALKDQYGQALTGKKTVSFKVEKSPARLVLSDKMLLTLDPAMPAELPLYSTNYRNAKLTIQAVQPIDWPSFFKLAQQLQQGQLEPKKALQLPGKTLTQQMLALSGKDDAIVTAPIDLKPWLKQGKLGQLVVLIEAGEASVKPRQNDSQPLPQLVWVQGTQLGLDAFAYPDKLLAWGGDLLTGKALPDLSFSLHSSTSTEAATQTSDDKGIASLPYLDKTSSAQNESIPESNATIRWLEAKHGDDVAILPEAQYPWGMPDTWLTRDAASQTLWYVFDDRHLYRPKEQVHLKGWVREREAKPESTLALPNDMPSLNYKVVDASGTKIANGETKLSGLGGFTLDFTLPDTPSLGNAQVIFRKPNAPETEVAYSHNFMIEEFRTPEFEVKTELVNAAPYIGQQPIQLSVNANYYAGGGLAAAPVRWSLRAEQQTYTPPNQSDWSFGFSSPTWLRWGGTDSFNAANADFSGKTNAEGKHQLLIQPQEQGLPVPLSVHAQAAVSDVNRQEWVANSNFLIHPAATYVGLKTPSYFVDQGKPLDLDVLTVDIEGKVAANQPVIVEAGLMDFVKDTLKEVQRCSMQTDEKGLAHCQFTTEKAGQYRITATTMDSEGRRNASRIMRWVSGNSELPTANNVEMERAQIIPDKESYAPHDTAKLLIQSPFSDAEGLLRVNYNGLRTQQRFRMQGNSHTLELPLKAEWLPGVELQVNLVGQTTRRSEDGKATNLPQRPAMASGELRLTISKAERTLSVKVAPQKEALAPAEEASITMQVNNAQGQPAANTEVALIVVDEAILAAGDYKLADPLDIFYPLVGGSPELRSLRSSVLLPALSMLEQNKLAEMTGNAGGRQRAAAPNAAPVMAMDAYKGKIAHEGMARFAAADGAANGGAAPPAITARTNFNPLAAFVPDLVTDAQGQVTTTIKLPDNLTRYRIMAIAAQDATHYGKGESHLTARKELMVRPSAPRFLNFGDSFELPVVLQNQTDQPLAVQVALAATNLELTAAKGYAVEVPANDRVEVRFPAKTMSAGEVNYQIAAATSQVSDAAAGSLPVWTPATSEAFATYGVLDQGAISQAIATPKEVIPQFGALKITTSSTALQSLTDAYLYLQNYPYSCSEQIASRMLSTSALKDVLQAFKAKDMPSPEAIEQSMQRDLKSLAQRQTGEGGFSLWGGQSRDWPYANVHVTHALLRAKQKGYQVDDNMLEQSLNYLRNIEQHFSKDYSPEVRRYIQPYSLYVRQLAGDIDRAKALGLIKQAGGSSKLSTESIGWLLNVLAGDVASAKVRESLLQTLLNRTQETASGAIINSDFGSGDYWVMHSDRAANGIVLEALIKDQPKSDLIPKLVKGLQNGRIQGHWGTTQANAFILLGLDNYFQTYEAQTPDFVAKAWLGKDFAGEQNFKVRSTDSFETEIPMEWLLQGEARRDLVLDKQGTGRLYYRIGLNYAPASLDLAAAEHGFTVSRSYRGLDNADDVKQREDGSWQVKAGARVEVTLTMLANAERHHVALVDALPAGFEALNPALAVSAKDTENDDAELVPFSWLGTWYEHQNLRDERAEAFTSYLQDGVYNYSYVARATTPGTFVVPPAKAEEMYHPETFGRSASAKVIIE